jgi:hypothetical protein
MLLLRDTMKEMRNISGSIISQQSIPLNPFPLGVRDIYATELSPAPASISLVSIIIPMFTVLAHILSLIECVGRNKQDLFSAAFIAVDNNCPANSSCMVKEHVEESQKTAAPTELGKGIMEGSIK